MPQRMRIDDDLDYSSEFDFEIGFTELFYR